MFQSRTWTSVNIDATWLQTASVLILRTKIRPVELICVSWMTPLTWRMTGICRTTSFSIIVVPRWVIIDRPVPSCFLPLWQKHMKMFFAFISWQSNAFSWIFNDLEEDSFWNRGTIKGSSELDYIVFELSHLVV